MPDAPDAPVAPPHPLSQFVLKVHSRCDLACDHCYVYEAADQSWIGKPMAMDLPVVHAAAARIAEHAAAWRLPSVRVIVHGGEPLLLGPDRMDATLTALRAGITPVTRLELVMQSNGVQLDRAMADVLARHDVTVGISLDGDRAANDRHRRYRHGASSFARVQEALALLRTPEYRRLYGGILCTIDVRNPPIDVYEALLAERPPRVDFLLPHATWEQPPDRPDGTVTPYADWLGVIHERWLADGRPMRVRLFDSLRSTANGGRSGSEQLGTDPVDLVVIDTDGRYEQADSLKIAYDGAPDTGLTVIDHAVDEVSRLAPVARRQAGTAGLSETCRACPVVTRCGGGLYAHRYRRGTGFDNPSVYCADLRALVDRVDAATAADTQVPAGGAAAVPVDLVDQVATGFGDPATMRWLVDAELNITRGLLAGMADTGHSPAAWKEFTDIDEEHPEATRRVLIHPFVRAWAVDQLTGARSNPGYLGALTIAAAVHADVDLDTDAALRDGVLHIPTVGTVYWPARSTGEARVRLRDGVIRVTAGGEMVAVSPRTDAASIGWQPVRRVTLDGLDLTLDDADPHRARHKWEPADRLDWDEFNAWSGTLTTAWRMIRDEVPGYVPGLRAGLRTVVPLRPDPAGLMRASTARNAFGSIAAARTDPADLAVALVHEFQHNKLGALIDLHDLFDLASDATLVVGWRPDPRPVEGVMQGVYAHAAVADIWRVRGGDSRDERARRNYVMYRDWTREALDKLRDSDALTPLGHRFLDGISGSMAGWPE